MSTPQILVGGSDAKKSTEGRKVQDWLPVAGLLGCILTVVGAADLILLWIPAQFGVAEFEYATIARFLNGLPVLTMGLSLLAIYGRAGARSGVLWFVGITAVFLCVAILTFAVLFALDVPLALKSVAPGALKLGIRKSIANAAIEAVSYLIGYIVLARLALPLGRR